MDSQVGLDEATDNVDPPSPVHASSPIKAAEDIVPSSTVVNDEINIIGEVFTGPEPSNVLAKVTTKDESAMPEKGKAKLELPNFEDIRADELHQGYFTQLSSSRDMEASLLNMLKRKYEV